MDNTTTNAQPKQPYERPCLVREGSLTDLTRTGTGAATDVGGLGSGA